MHEGCMVAHFLALFAYSKKLIDSVVAHSPHGCLLGTPISLDC